MYRASWQLGLRALVLLAALGLARAASAQAPSQTPGEPAPREPEDPTSRPAPIDIHGGAAAPASRPAVSSPSGPAPSPTPGPPAKRPRAKAPSKPLPPPAVRALRRHPAIGRRFFLGVGLSLGFFWPPDVNAYLEGYQDSFGTTVEESGTSAMFFNLIPRVALAVNIGRYLQLAAQAEIGWGPKAIVESSSGESELFSFMRYSGGLIVSGNLPVSELRGDSIFFGLGGMVHHMRFESYEATAPGLRGTAGYRFYEGIMLIDAFIGFDLVKGDTGEPIGFGNQSSMTLNYSGIHFGATVYFGVL